MNAIPTCREVEPDLVAVAAGEAGALATQGVERHVAICRSCRDELGRYRVLEGMVSDLRRAPMPGADPTLARAELESRLADIRSRMITYGLYSSPLGRILIARSELGVSMVRYVDSDASARSHLKRLAGDEAVEDEAAIEPVYRELLDYLSARETRLSWSLDLRWAGSDFQRRVLAVTAQLPYGAVASYGGIARQIGAPGSVRAVAQALRHNPLAIAIPCHRVIGSTGALTGYAGTRIGLKKQLLSLEGVPVGAHASRVDRRSMYVWISPDKEYCVPSCGSLSEMPLAQLTLFGSREHAEAVGLSPCSSCRPDLHPLPA
jgi:methylated-DNA-[protein]-cysteine S-methyltransferase